MTLRRDIGLGAAILLVVGYALLARVVPPSMYSDSAHGFRIADSVGRGARFYELIQPDPEDITKDRRTTNVVWSPGQWVIPATLERLGPSLGTALTLTVLVFTGLGLWGYRALFVSLGLSAQLVSGCALVLACQRFVALPFGIYNGGEVLAFGFTPWALLCAYRLRAWWAPMVLWPVLAFGVFLKLSFLVSALAIVIFVVAHRFNGARGLSIGGHRGGFSSLAVMSVVFGSLYGAVSVFYTSKGWTAVGTERTPDLVQTLTSTSFAFVASVFSGFSLGDLLQRFLMFPGAEIYRGYDEALPLLLAALIPAGLVLASVLRNSRLPADYRLLVGVVVLVHLVIYVYLFATRPSVSLDERRLRFVGILFLPGALATVASLKRFIRPAAYAAVAVSCLYGVTSYFVRLEHRRAIGAVGGRGFSHEILSAASLVRLRELANEAPDDAVIYVTAPSLALELPGRRVIATHADFESLDWLQSVAYRGRVDALYLFVQSRFEENGKAAAIRASFEDYDRGAWNRLFEDDFLLDYQGAARPVTLP